MASITKNKLLTHAQQLEKTAAILKTHLALSSTLPRAFLMAKLIQLTG